MDVGLSILRIVFGVAFAAHGAQKLFGWFGGYGLEGTGGFIESIGFRPGRRVAAFLGSSEIVGGLLVASGFLTPLGAAMLIGVMIPAILVVKRGQGLIGGFELELLYLVAAIALGFTGSGAYSLDATAGWDLSGHAWGLGALALGIVSGGSALASRRQVETVEDVRQAA